MNNLIESKKVIVCVGTGGVGKTTTSASMAVLAAKKGKRVLVLTIDPAKRLATSLGLIKIHSEYTEVEGLSCEGKMFAGQIHSDQIFERFIRKSLDSEEDVQKILKNPLYQQLATTLSGSQEFTSLEELLSAHESGRFDLIILDTPPAQHAVDFLSAPEKIYSLFQESITKWFVKSPEKSPGFFQRVIEQGTKKVMGVLEMVTGSSFVTELSLFFESVWGLQKNLRVRSLAVKDLLKSEEAAFVLVTSSDSSKLKEAEVFAQSLRNDGYHLDGVIVNKSVPGWVSEDLAFGGGDQELSGDLGAFREKILNFYKARLIEVEAFAAKFSDGAKIIAITEKDKDIFGLDGLELLASEIDNKLKE